MSAASPRTVVVFGGAGFVGLNIAQQLLARGDHVRSFDRLPLPRAAQRVFAALPGRLETVTGDVTDARAVAHAIAPGTDAVVLGSAITADAARESRDPESVLQVNLMALPALLRACRDSGVRRVVNLSSAAAYGQAAMDVARVDETTAPQPAVLYGITKLASEMVGQRLAQLWSLDVVSLRLSAVFGPWERATGVRDTTSAPFQITEALHGGRPALLQRPGVRDWIYAPDVAGAVLAVIDAAALQHRLYNVSSGTGWSALAWGEALAAFIPGADCRLAEDGEPPTIDLHAAADRAPLSVERLADELGWRAAYGLADSAAHLQAWRQAIDESDAPVAADGADAADTATPSLPKDTP